MTDGPRSPAGVAARVREVVAERVSEVRIRNGEVVVRAPATGVADLLRALAGDERLTLSALADLTAVDHVFGPDRFELVYQLLSPESGHRVRVSVPVGEGRRSAESVTAVHAVADWLEREVFEQFGIRFEGHPDLRRILLEADANPHPLRKDAIEARPGRAARSVG